MENTLRRTVTQNLVYQIDTMITNESLLVTPGISAKYLECAMTTVFIHKVKAKKEATIPGALAASLSPQIIIGISILIHWLQQYVNSRIA